MVPTTPIIPVVFYRSVYFFPVPASLASREQSLLLRGAECNFSIILIASSHDDDDVHAAMGSRLTRQTIISDIITM